MLKGKSAISGKNGVRSRVLMTLPLLVIVAASCSKPGAKTVSDAAGNPPPPGAPSGRMRGGWGGPGGGRRGGGGGPVAETATGSQIYDAKCRCHGSGGQGGRAPVLTGVARRPDAELIKTIHDGHGKMPAFGSQLSATQITKVVAYLKTLTPAK